MLLDYFFTMRKIPSYFNVCLLLQCKPQSDQEKNANNKLSFLTTGLCLTTLNLIFCFPLPGPSLLSSIPVLHIQSLHFLENSVKKTSHLPSQVWTNDRNDTETPLWARVSWLIITVSPSRPDCDFTIYYFIKTTIYHFDMRTIFTGGVCCFLLIAGFINDHKQFRQYWGL